MTADNRKPLLETLRDQYGVQTVAAQNIVAHDNPAWEALRRIAAKRAEQESGETYLVMWLSRLTGQMGIVLHAAQSELRLAKDEDPVRVRMPRQFTTREKAEAWCRIHANPESVRHMIVAAVSDEVYPKTYDPNKKINRAEIEAWLATMGFEAFPEIEAWSDGIVQIPEAQLAELVTWGDLVRMLDLG